MLDVVGKVSIGIDLGHVVEILLSLHSIKARGIGDGKEKQSNVGEEVVEERVLVVFLRENFDQMEEGVGSSDFVPMNSGHEEYSGESLVVFLSLFEVADFNQEVLTGKKIEGGTEGRRDV